ALINTYSLYLQTSLAATAQIQASYLLEEGQEAARFLRDSSWSSNMASLAPGSPYYLSFSTTTSTWTVSATPSLVDGMFARRLVVSSVSRNSSSDIVTTGGTLDPQTKR